MFPEAAGQRCWNHRMLNVLDRIPKRLHADAKGMLTKIPYAETRADAERRKAAFQRWCRFNQCEEAAALLDRDWERLVAFYAFPKQHWRHLRTSNPIESPFAALRLRTDAAKRFKRAPNATAVVWKMLLLAEQSFRRLNAPELLREVYLGATYVDGIRSKKQEGSRKAAA